MSGFAYSPEGFRDDRHQPNGDWLSIQLGRYRDGTLGFSLTVRDTGELYATPTVCLELNAYGRTAIKSYVGSLDQGVIVKDYSENKGMFDVLVRAGIVEPKPVGGIHIGMGMGVICRLSESFMDSEPYKTFVESFPSPEEKPNPTSSAPAAGPSVIALTPEQVEQALTDKDRDVRHVLIERTDIALTPEQVERALTDKDVWVRRDLVGRTDIPLTPEQVERALTDEVWEVRCAIIGRPDIHLTSEQVERALTDKIGLVREAIIRRTDIALSPEQMGRALTDKHEWVRDAAQSRSRFNDSEVYETSSAPTADPFDG